LTLRQPPVELKVTDWLTAPVRLGQRCAVPRTKHSKAVVKPSIAHTFNTQVAAMFGLGPLELIIFAVIVLLLFGNRLPSVMRSVGQGLVEFKKGVQGVEDDKERPQKS
jgi:sec-independent protein translocase protein TatA